MKFLNFLSLINRSTLVYVITGWSLIVILLYGFADKYLNLETLHYFFIWLFGVLGIMLVSIYNNRVASSSEKTKDTTQISDLLYRAIVETSPDSILVMDLSGKFIFCSKQTALLHGYDEPEDLIGKSVFLLFPRKNIMQAARCVRLTREGGMIQNLEVDLMRKDGSYFPAELSMSLVKNKLGLPVAFLSIVRDTTERKWMEAQIRESDLLYRVVADNTYNWEFYQAPNDRFIYISPSCKRITGYDDIEFIKDPEFMLKIVHPEDREKYTAHHQTAARKDASEEIEFRIIRADGGERWIGHVCQPVSDKNGKFVGIRGSNRDITEKKRVENELQDAYDKVRAQLNEIEKLHNILHEQSIRDPLTGLYNRRYMEEALKQEYSRAVRENHPISIVMLDMDLLKDINDTCGHAVGDKALIMLSDCITNMTRVEDIACRYGGDEFLVILHNTTADDAFKRTEEWRKSMDEIPIPCRTDVHKITFSAGIASFPAHGKSIEEIIHAADIALYNAKAMGRNNTVISN